MGLEPSWPPTPDFPWHEEMCHFRWLMNGDRYFFFSCWLVFGIWLPGLNLNRFGFQFWIGFDSDSDFDLFVTYDDLDSDLWAGIDLLLLWLASRFIALMDCRKIVDSLDPIHRIHRIQFPSNSPPKITPWLRHRLRWRLRCTKSAARWRCWKWCPRARCAPLGCTEVVTSCGRHLLRSTWSQKKINTQIWWPDFGTSFSDIFSIHWVWSGEKVSFSDVFGWSNPQSFMVKSSILAGPNRIPQSFDGKTM